jgi:hypothetical protein
MFGFSPISAMMSRSLWEWCTSRELRLAVCVWGGGYLDRHGASSVVIPSFLSPKQICSVCNQQRQTD